MTTKKKSQWSYADFKAAGICPGCRARKPVEGKSLCEKCRSRIMSPANKAKMKKLRDAYQERNMAQGLCIRCKRPAVEGYKLCAVCRDRGFEARKTLKRQVMDKYGGKCACCGEDAIEFLTIDHVYNNGAEHRREVKAHVYGAVLREPYSDQYQVLCMNCNFAKGKYGCCPHERGKK